MEITLLLADVLSVPAIRQEAFSRRAATLFARCKVEQLVDDERLVPPEMPWEQWLRTSAGLADGCSVEAASAFSDGQPEGRWRVTPVHLHAGLDHVRLEPPLLLDLDETDASELASDIDALLAESGFRLHRPHPMRWYLEPVTEDAGRLLPAGSFGWRSASGRSIEAFSPAGSTARPWRRLLTEIQMTWHEHAANARRQARGQASVNSLWLDGFAGAATRFPFDACYSTHESVRGLAISAGLSASGSAGVLARNRSGRPTSILVVPDLTTTSGQPYEDDSEHLWDQLSDWVAANGETLSRALSPHAVTTASTRHLILTGNRRRVHLSVQGADRWKFWRSVETSNWFEWSDRDR